ncbi:MAG TPA: CopD family protein [Actinomycetales bacterium]|nr:CopD family protein [Actinomycetales bacterium]
MSSQLIAPVTRPVPVRDRGAIRPRTAPRRDPAVVTGVAAVALGVLAVLVLALVVGGGRPAPGAQALGESGPLTGWGLPVATLASHVAAVGTVGSLLFAAFLVRGRGGVLVGSALRAVRAGAWWAAGWAVTVAVTGVLTVSDLLGVPVGALTPAAVLDVVTGIDQGRAYAAVLALAGVIAVGAWRCRTVRGAGLLLVVAVVAVLPPTLTGHSATADNHQIAIASLMVHVVAATVWVGGLLALVTFGRAAGSSLPRGARRFSELALVCFVGIGVSGLLNAYLALGGGDRAIAALSSSGYGWLVLAKTAALVVLGAFGWWHRRRTLRRLADGSPRAFRRLAAVEVVVLLATVAMAVALARTPTPALDQPAASSAPAAPSSAGEPASAPPVQDMSGHDHGELSVSILVTEGTFMVGGPVSPGDAVTVFNAEDEAQTITAEDGSFDVTAEGSSLFSFTAPATPGDYAFVSTADGSYRGVLVVR